MQYTEVDAFEKALTEYRESAQRAIMHAVIIVLIRRHVIHGIEEGQEFRAEVEREYAVH
jgi:hypothetical protein